MTHPHLQPDTLDLRGKLAEGFTLHDILDAQQDYHAEHGKAPRRLVLARGQHEHLYGLFQQMHAERGRNPLTNAPIIEGAKWTPLDVEVRP